MTRPELRRRLTLSDAAALFVGIILGSGIFVAPSAVAAAAPGFGGAAGLWLLGGIVTACGALCYAECGARLPRTGGFYVFYREAFGEAAAFVGGWIALFVTYPASIAAIALILARYLGEGIGPWLVLPETTTAAAVIALAVLLNVLGVRLGAWSQRILTSTKVLALAALCAAALWAPSRPAAPFAAPVTDMATLGVWLGALVAVLWTYDGWSDVSLVAGELRDPGRDLGRAVFVGAVVLVGLYVVVQAAVASLLPAAAAAASPRVVADAVEVALGPRAAGLVALIVVVSTFGSVQGIVLTVSRLGFAMARDGAFVGWFGAVHPRWETPARATLALGAAAVVYVYAASFRNLLNYFSFCVWLFYGLTAIGLLVLRRRGVGGTVGWRAPGGIAPPLVVVATAVLMSGGLLVQNPRGSLYGVAMIAAGGAVYAWTRLARRRSAG